MTDHADRTPSRQATGATRCDCGSQPQRAVLLVALGGLGGLLPAADLGQRLGVGDVGDAARHVVAERPGGARASRRAARPSACRGWRRRSSPSRRRSRAASAAGRTARRRSATPAHTCSPRPSKRSTSWPHSAWIRRPITAGKRWIAGFVQHTATNASSSIAAIRAASRWPSRACNVAGPANAHSIGTCWSSSIPISSAVPSVFSSSSAAGSPVMYSVPVIDGQRVVAAGPSPW